MPGFTVIAAGGDRAFRDYARAKVAACEQVGMAGKAVLLPEATTEAELLAEIGRWNQDAGCHGILVQLPLPDHIDEARALAAVAPEKDVDGLHPYNLGLMLAGGGEGFVPATAAAGLELLARVGIETRGARATVVGTTSYLARASALLLSRKGPGGDATVTMCASNAPDLAHYTRDAEILVSDCGRPGLITGEMVRPGAAVIDLGAHRVPDASRKRGWRLAGDADPRSVAEVAGWMTPVPGGVGPLTIPLLLAATVRAARRDA